jgi:hypothetical protein
MAFRGKHSEEAKEKIRLSKQGKIPDAETRARMSAAQKRRAHVGVPHSDETKHKIASLRAGTSASEETRAKMSARRKGVAKSEETRRRMSAVQQDRTLPANRRRSEATSKRNVDRALAGHEDWLVKGYHPSSKTPRSPTPYRSKSIELRLMIAFDADNSVRAWESPFVVRYESSTGLKRHALPDFLVVFTDGRRKVVEGKSPHLLEKYLQSEKFIAVRQWCRTNGVEFDVVHSARRGLDLVTTRIV